jgi:hypothetical protein
MGIEPTYLTRKIARDEMANEGPTSALEPHVIANDA